MRRVFERDLVCTLLLLLLLLLMLLLKRFEERRNVLSDTAKRIFKLLASADHTRALIAQMLDAADDVDFFDA